MNRQQESTLVRAEALVIGVLLGLALLGRLFTLAGPMEEPAWRQADTAYMALRMADESPPDLLNPKTPFRGQEDVKAAEFPLYPFFVSLTYKLAGGEHLVLARLVALLFFLGSAWYLFLILRLVLGTRVAWYSIVFYAFMPLGILYSRAVHPDFCIVFFSHAFAYYFLTYFTERREAWRYAVAVLACTAAFLMKAPYGFYLGLPVAAWVLSRKTGWTPRNIGAMAFVFVIPLAAAIWFNEHRIALEAGFEESLVYPMKWTHESSTGRFFGVLAQRFDTQLWDFFIRRLVILVTGVPGALAALAGAVLLCFRGLRPFLVMLAWGVGLLLYTLLVFPMVTSPHEYYTIPFMAFFAGLAALCVERLVGSISDFPVRAAAVGGVAVVLMLAGTAYGMKRGPYVHGAPMFTYDWQRIEGGGVIREHTAPDDLVLSVTLGRSTGWSDPRILYFAERKGWAIELKNLNADNLRAFREAGASVAALLLTPLYMTSEENYGVLAGYPHEVLPVFGPGEERIGHMVLFELASAAGESEF